MSVSLKRTAQLGLLARDLAVVRRRAPGPKRDEARQRLVNRLGLLHGLPQKIGQLLAFSEIEASDSAFTRLTENEPSLSTIEARAEVERQLGAPVATHFSAFAPRGISASVGQVHRATLHDGREVAVKIQHPGIAATINYDLLALGWLTAPIGGMRRDFDIDAYRTEIGNSLRSEVDYRHEAKSLTEFGELARGLASPIVVPKVVPDLSNEHLLVTTWLEGENLREARLWPLPDRAALSTSLIELFFKGLFDWGLLHADPHPGNYRFLRVGGRPTVGLLDFGCVKTVPPALQAGIRGLMCESQAGSVDPERIREYFLQLGFDPAILKRLAKKLVPVAAVLAEPFAAQGTFNVATWNLKDRLGEILGADRMTFRAGGSPEIIFILRAFQGLLHYLKLLDAPVNWASATASLAHAHVTPTVAAAATTVPMDSPMLSETLHIRVLENGTCRVDLTFGAGATDHLPDLVPLDLRSRLDQREIRLASIASNARRNNYAPGELFALVDGAKDIRVWLQ